jgi:Family of unknown function (DUF6279)
LLSIQRHFATIVRIIGLLSFAVALGACSAIKLGYNTLPQLSLWWLDGYIDFSDDQEQRVREDFARLHQWHRREELPKLSALLQQAERMAPGDITAEAACAFVPAARERLLAIGLRAEPAAATLALQLTPEQLAHLQGKYEKNVREYRKEWLQPPAEDGREKRFKQYLERMEMVYGSLEEPQRAILRAQVDRSVFDPELALRERQRRQQDILGTLRKLAGQPVPLGEAHAAVHRLVEHALQSPDPRYRSYQNALVQEGCRNIAVVHNSTTPQQRQGAVRRLRAYQRDLAELAAQP